LKCFHATVEIASKSPRLDVNRGPKQPVKLNNDTYQLCICHEFCLPSIINVMRANSSHRTPVVVHGVAGIQPVVRIPSPHRIVPHFRLSYP
jgi:hypothetical protein